MRRLLKWRVLLALLAVGTLGGGALFYYQLHYVRNFHVVKPGVLYRCRQPEGLQWGVLGRYGIKAVVDLRLEEEDPTAFAEEKHACASARVELVNIPVGDLVPPEKQIEQFLRAVVQYPPVLVHCQHGRNRTAFMVACYRVVFEGWDVDRAMAEMVATGAELEGSPLNQTKQKLTREMLTSLQAHREDWLRRVQSASAPAQ